MPQLMVATTLRSDYAEFHDENRATVNALADRGLRPELHPWHTDFEPWVAADLVLVRTTWDYPEHLDDFEYWLDCLEYEGIRTVNPIPFLRWNLRKRYLLELEDHGVPIVPARLVIAGSTLAPADYARVLKPEVGVGGQGASLVEPGETPTIFFDAIVNPFLPTVFDGERSVFLVEGEPVQVFRKTPPEGEFRVHPHWGGTYEVDESPSPAAVNAARLAYETADKITGGGLTYLRVDLLEGDNGEWLVLETEGLEPSLYPLIDKTVVDALAGAVSKMLPET